MMKILVLGGNGFIGSHIVEHLLKDGHDVRIFDRSANRWQPPHPQVSYFVGDFSDAPMLAEAMQGVHAVVHSISTTVPSTSNLDPIADIQSNLVNSVQLMRMMAMTGVSRLVFISSGGTVYGVPQQLPVAENHPLNPICSYGVVKLAIEKYMGMFECLHGVRALILRASNPFGPLQGHGGVQGAVATFMQKIMAEEKITIWGDGSVRRDFLYVTDLAELCRKAVVSEEAGVFNAGCGQGYTLSELIVAIEGVVGKKALVNYEQARKFDIQDIVLDIQKARQTFNWAPQVQFEQGLSLHHAWLSSSNL